MGDTVKIIELTGTSSESWEHAAQNALEDADRTVEHITGIEVQSQSAAVENGQIDHYKTTLHISFTLER